MFHLDQRTRRTQAHERKAQVHAQAMGWVYPSECWNTVDLSSNDKAWTSQPQTTKRPPVHDAKLSCTYERRNVTHVHTEPAASTDRRTLRVLDDAVFGRKRMHVVGGALFTSLLGSS
jgi:hypothetical protein